VELERGSEGECRGMVRRERRVKAIGGEKMREEGRKKEG